MHELFTSHSLFRERAHAAHTEHCEALSKLVATKDAAPRRKAFSELEATLLAHLRAEEELLLPDFGLVYASDAAHVRAQHEQIRQQLVRFDGAQGDEALVGPTLEQLGRLLRDCAAFKQRLLYPWAEQQLRASKKGEFLQRSRRQSLAAPRHSQA